MYVFKDDRVIEFDGELSADTLVEFLLDVSGENILLTRKDHQVENNSCKNEAPIKIQVSPEIITGSVI